ncbi:MAG: hypothetical protein PHQ23_05395 [Candidatus Wallbacteria bacterium]|nr:hypothetical protein [Candidatus Wallbacteria bacterium]
MNQNDFDFTLRLKLLEEAGRVLHFSDDQSIEGVLVELIENLDAARHWGLAVPTMLRGLAVPKS